MIVNLPHPSSDDFHVQDNRRGGCYCSKGSYHRQKWCVSDSTLVPKAGSEAYFPVVLVTGASPKSLGAETVRVLAPYAKTIIIASRSKERYRLSSVFYEAYLLNELLIIC